MKRFIVALVLAAGCSRHAVVSTGVSDGSLATNPNVTGAATARAAVESFLAAVKAQDLQAMAIIWGTDKGAARDVAPRDQLEKRELIMQCYLSHDRYQILSERTIGAKQQFHVQLTRGRVTRETDFTTIAGPGGRWYLEGADLKPVADLCANPPS